MRKPLLIEFEPIGVKRVSASLRRAASSPTALPPGNSLAVRWLHATLVVGPR